VTITPDTLVEGNETVVITMGAPTNATPGGITEHTVNILDDDGAPLVNFTSASQASAGESGTLTVTAQLSTISPFDVTVPFSVSGTAANPADYTITASPVVIPAGSTTADITISIAGDTLDENDETVIVTMGLPINADQGGSAVHTATITDDDASPSVTFTSASQSSVGETGNLTVTAQLSTVSALDVSVPFTLGGTATSPADYTITGSPVTIPAGSTSVDITITIQPDTLDEADETAIVTMGTPTNAVPGATTVHTATLTDDDAGPTVSFAAGAQSSVGENGTLSVSVILSAVSGLPVSVPFTLSGTALNPADYTITASPLVIPAGNPSGQLILTIAPDTLNEGNETVVLTMGTLVNGTPGATTVHTATITDDDSLPAVDFTSVSQTSAGESGVLTITAQLSALSGLNVTVPFTVGGTATDPADYTITSSPIVIPAGSLSTDISLTIAADSLDEGNETVVVTMGTPTNAIQGAATVHSATITDDDPIPTVNFTSSLQSPSP